MKTRDEEKKFVGVDEINKIFLSLSSSPLNLTLQAVDTTDEEDKLVEDLFQTTSVLHHANL